MPAIAATTLASRLNIHSFIPTFWGPVRDKQLQAVVLVASQNFQ